MMTTSRTTPPGRRCRACGRRHRFWFTVARCLWPTTVWTRGWPPGDGPCYAVLAHCAPGLTVVLYASADAASASLAGIGVNGCGGRCRGNHELIVLRAEGEAGE